MKLIASGRYHFHPRNLLDYSSFDEMKVIIEKWVKIPTEEAECGHEGA